MAAQPGRAGRAALRAMAAGVLIALGAAGCTSNEPAAEQPKYIEPAPVTFPIPPETKINRDETIAVGSSVDWFGTLVLSSDLGMNQVQYFYEDRLSHEGWEPLSALIANRVVLQYVNRARGRACVVTIENSGFFSGTRVEVVVAPLTGTRGS